MIRSYERRCGAANIETNKPSDSCSWRVNDLSHDLVMISATVTMAASAADDATTIDEVAPKDTNIWGSERPVRATMLGDICRTQRYVSDHPRMAMLLRTQTKPPMIIPPSSPHDPAITKRIGTSQTSCGLSSRTAISTPASTCRSR